MLVTTVYCVSKALGFPQYDVALYFSKYGGSILDLINVAFIFYKR